MALAGVGASAVAFRGSVGSARWASQHQFVYVGPTLEPTERRRSRGDARPFTEPANGPGAGTMHTLDEIMAVAPAMDDTNGASAAEVAGGKTFWGLTTGGWGMRTGTAAVGSNVNGADGARTFAIPDGFYMGKTATAQHEPDGREHPARGEHFRGGWQRSPSGRCRRGGSSGRQDVFQCDTGRHRGEHADRGAVILTPGPATWQSPRAITTVTAKSWGTQT